MTLPLIEECTQRLTSQSLGKEASSSLPRALLRWNHYERRMMHRGGDPLRITPEVIDLDFAYLPESSTCRFEILAYWIEARFIKYFAAEPIEQDLLDTFFRMRHGRPSVLFLMHPVARQFYTGFLKGCRAELAFRAGEGFWGSPTASSRTLLVWRDGFEERAFLAKLSLPAVIGECQRTLSAETLTRSVGVTSILDGARPELPGNFKFLRETLAIVPRGANGCGFLIRSIPRELFRDAVTYVPMFSLYAQGRSRIPMLAHLIRSSRMGAHEFLLEYLLAPFAQQWARLVVEEGFIPEPHAQNLLVEMDQQNRLTGTFIHRDMESFYVDLRHRRKAGKYVPAVLPAIAPLPRNYEQFRLLQRAFNSVHRYFQGTVLYELDRLLPLWKREGIVNGVKSCGDLEATFVRELECALALRSDRPVRLQGMHYCLQLKRAILRARRNFISGYKAA